MATPKTWKPRTQTQAITQRGARRLAALRAVDDAPTLPASIENNPVALEHVQRLLGKLHRLADVYGPTDALQRFELALDRLIVGGVQ